jgi:hypothetical protein
MNAAQVMSAIALVPMTGAAPAMGARGTDGSIPLPEGEDAARSAFAEALAGVLGLVAPSLPVPTPTAASEPTAGGIAAQFGRTLIHAETGQATIVAGPVAAGMSSAPQAGVAPVTAAPLDFPPPIVPGDAGAAPPVAEPTQQPEGAFALSPQQAKAAPGPAASALMSPVVAPAPPGMAVPLPPVVEQSVPQGASPVVIKAAQSVALPGPPGTAPAELQTSLEVPTAAPAPEPAPLSAARSLPAQPLVQEVKGAGHSAGQSLASGAGADAAPIVVGGGSANAGSAPDGGAQGGNSRRDANPAAPVAALSGAEATSSDTSFPDAVASGSPSAPALASIPSDASSAARATPETAFGLAAEMARKLDARVSRFDLQLDPAGLGQVDVKLEINAAGEVSARLMFDRPEAAAELRARAAELRTALEQAGFSLSAGGLSFDSAAGGRRSPEQGFAQGQERQDARFRFEAAPDLVPDTPLARHARAPRGLDVRI